MTTLRQDIRYGARVLSRSPVTTAVAILSLALGIGANTAIFSLLNALILRPLPIPNAEQLVRLSTTTPQDPEREDGLTLAMYRQLRQDQRVFSDLFGWNGGGIVNLEANGVKYVASFTEVTGEYFSTLGVPMHLGRAIAPEDLRLDSGKPAPVAVIGYGCWQRRYQGDPAVIGKTIRVEDRPRAHVVPPRDGREGVALPDDMRGVGGGRSRHEEPRETRQRGEREGARVDRSTNDTD